ncbi:MAG: hypothetical protein CVU54_14970 [Deltaproteobacteria bacterium HGW-Deltaproteobacteria-12]|jgi:mono/diheme cytochrome c family protein|nr:MAG: hypothetical protein CVU54_14970 [Deltaproteobacteria bacterium HGW-Deltaproteobacteria-12]
MKNSFVILVIGAFLFLFMASPVVAQSEVKALVEKECSRCHGIARVNKASKDAAAWEKTVNRMIKKGAAIKPEEKDDVIKYLSTLKK